MNKIFHPKNNHKHNVWNNIAVFISIISFLITAITAYIHNEMEVSVTNAVQQNQIDSINKRLDYIESKLKD